MLFLLSLMLVLLWLLLSLSDCLAQDRRPAHSIENTFYREHILPMDCLIAWHRIVDLPNNLFFYLFIYLFIPGFLFK
jgi:4-amino-4-deoxy-L-arabinose transferase-like glycosyltransferase